MKNLFNNVREQVPLVHCITNYVTVNDCANVLLACGASPIMADEADEVAEITTLCRALVLNIGTLNTRTVQAMRLAGQTAGQLGHPVLLDPVGAGASRLRTATAMELLENLNITVLRGNISEIKAVATGNGATQGVDAAPEDEVTEANLPQTLAFVRTLARRTHTIVAVSGAIDVLADADRVASVRNGHPLMPKVTGSGCMLSALVGAFLAANPVRPFDATLAAFCAMGVCGERAAKTASGNASFRSGMLDAMSQLDGETLEREAKYVLH